MKKSKSIILVIAPVLSSLLYGACGGSATTSRDVYQNKEDCAKDWGEQDLCQEMSDEDAREYQSRGGVFVGRPFFGPRYNPTDRAVIYNGRTISPTSRSTALTPFVVTSRSSSPSRSGISSPRSSSTSYGGFGGRSSSISS